MLKILSVQNFHRWSWACILQLLKKLYINTYCVWYVIKDQKERIAQEEIKADLILVQNVDSIHLITNKSKVVARIGGIGMEAGKLLENCHKYDDVLSSVGAVVGTSAELAALGQRNNPNTFIIANGTDLQLFTPMRAESSKSPKPFIIGFAGNISISHYMNYKGYPQIVGAQMTLALDTKLKLALYGPGQFSHDQMPKAFYAQIDCLVNASEGEGCSNTIVEALACGIPVLLTKVGYHGEQLIDECNCLFIERTSEDIAAKIKMLMNDSLLWKRLSVNGRAFAEEHHDIKAIAKQYDEVFQQVHATNTKQKD